MSNNGITDKTFIDGVKSAYRKKGRPVNVQEVIDAINLKLDGRTTPRKRSLLGRLAGAITKFEVKNKLNELARKGRIKKITRNKKQYYKP